MALVGYTDGGSPIFDVFGGGRLVRKPRQPRFRCPCGQRTQLRQAKRNGGVCFACRRPLPGFVQWRTG